MCFTTIEGASPDKWPDLLARHFAARGGWRQRDYLFLQPVPTSFRVGWQGPSRCGCIISDDPVERLTVARFWAGEWQDQVENIIRYSMNTATNPQWSSSRGYGYAEYIPRGLANEMKRRNTASSR